MNHAGSTGLPPADHPKGRITTEFTVWCGCCYRQEQRSAHLEGHPRDWAKREGWVKTRGRGWICPPCARDGRARAWPKGVTPSP